MQGPTREELDWIERQERLRKLTSRPPPKPAQLPALYWVLPVLIAAFYIVVLIFAPK